MDTAPFDVPTALTGAVLLGKNGEWICQFETNKHYDDSSEWIHSSVLMFSRDDGATWPEYALASRVGDDQIFYWDQRPGVAPNGDILDLFWTYDNANAKYLNIHARHSDDGGRTWSAVRDTGAPGQPAPPVFLPDGKIAMVYVDREAAPTLKLRVSHDNGASWLASSEATLYQLPSLAPMATIYQYFPGEATLYQLPSPTQTQSKGKMQGRRWGNSRSACQSPPRCQMARFCWSSMPGRAPVIPIFTGCEFSRDECRGVKCFSLTCA